MKKISLAVLVLSLAYCAMAQDAATSPSNITKTIRPGEQPQQSGTIYYGGGPIMSGSTNVYVVFYGNWPSASVNIINGYLANVNGSHEYKVNTTYSDTTGAHVQNVVNYNPATNSFNDNYSLGKQLTDADIQTIVSNAIGHGHLPNDQANGVYFVLTASDVTESAPFGTFCGNFCGYHSPSTSIVSGETIKYAFVGNPAECPSACDGNVGLYGDKTSPNGDIGGDGTVNVMFHELSETVSDPNVTLSNGAWGDLVTGESGDMCNFFFGHTKIAPNGSHYNQTINGTRYLVQEMFKVPKKNRGVRFYNGVCVLQLK